MRSSRSVYHPPRVAVVATSYPEREGDPSGHFVGADVDALCSSGAVVEVFAPRGAAFGWPGIAARIGARPWRVASLALGLIRLRTRVRDASRARPFDRLVLHWAVPSAWPIASGIAGAREVVSHGGDVRLLLALPSPIRKAIVDAILSPATTTWRFVSAHLRDALAAALSADLAARLREVAVVAPSAIAPMPDFLSERAAAIRASRPPFAVVAARLVPGKRVDVAIAHAAREATPLVVLGDGPERARLERIADAAGASVDFLGLVPRDLALAHIAAATALLHASRTEGASTVVREAEILGTPVVVLP